MRPLVKTFFLINSIVFLLLPTKIKAQACFPINEGEKSKHVCYIEMPKSYISGICLLCRQHGVVNGSIINEFGITAIDFAYNPVKRKVKLYTIVEMLDKWYIKRILKRDLCHLMQELEKGKHEYVNNKYHITYTLNHY